MTAPTEGTVELPTVEGLMELVTQYGHARECRGAGKPHSSLAEARRRVRDYAERLSRSPVVGAVGGEPAADFLTDAYAEGRRDEQEELASVLPGTTYMDPPDGGAPTILEQLQRQAKDAARYVWLRQQDWFDGPLCVLRDPKKVLTRGSGLGADCPSRDRLDAAIDAAMGGIGVSPTGSPEGEVSNHE